MAAMPPPGVAGSKRAKTKLDSALAACAGSAKATSPNPADYVKRIGEACAAASKMKPVGPMMRGQQGDKDPHQENKLRADANHCYRVYFAGDEGVKDMVVVLRDSAGDVIATSPGPAVPQDGAVCFTAPDEVSVLVGVGTGKGSWAAQVWSN
jgi:putative component of toxin-antitoxin plasmid stabilization module